MSEINLRQRAIQLLEFFKIDFNARARFVKKVKTYGFNRNAQTEYLQDFLTWLEDGSNPLQAAKGIATGYQVDEGDSLPVELKVTMSLVEALSSGGKIYEGMIDWFDDDIVAVFEAGEKAGPEALNLMLQEFLKQNVMINEVKSKLFKPVMAPLIYVVMLFVLLSGFHYFLLPSFFEIMPLEQWEVVVQAANGFVNFVWGNFFLLLLVGFAFFFGVKWYLINGVGPKRKVFDGYYPFSLYRNITSMKLVKTLGILVLVGDNPKKAVLRLLQVATPYEKLYLNSMNEMLMSGEQRIERFMDVGLLEKPVMQRLKTIAAVSSEETRKEAISKAADRSGREVLRVMAKSTRWAVTCAWLLVALIAFMAAMSFVGVMDIQSSLTGT